MNAKELENYLMTNYDEVKHDCQSLIDTCEIVGLRHGAKPVDLLFLLIENKPIDDLYTHSYGFQTRNGRGLIREIQTTYMTITQTKDPYWAI